MPGHSTRLNQEIFQRQKRSVGVRELLASPGARSAMNKITGPLHPAAANEANARPTNGIVAVPSGPRPRLFFITFGSEGPPHDDGLNLSPEIDKLEQCVRPHVHAFIRGTPRMIRAEAPEVVLAQDDKYKLPMNPTYHKVNFGAFKTYLALKVMRQNMTGNDILIWRDGNWKKSNIARDCATIADVAIMIMTATPIFMPWQGRDLRMYHHVKRYSITKYAGAQRADAFGNWNAVVAAYFFARKTPLTEELLQEVHTIVMQPDMVGRIPNPDPHPKFRWSCGDQDAFNLVFRNATIAGRLPPKWPGLYTGKSTLVIGDPRKPSYLGSGTRSIRYALAALRELVNSSRR